MEQVEIFVGKASEYITLTKAINVWLKFLEHGITITKRLQNVSPNTDGLHIVITIFYTVNEDPV